MGCGSGAISLSLAKENQNVFCTAIDVSSEAFELAKENCTRYAVWGQCFFHKFNASFQYSCYVYTDTVSFFRLSLSSQVKILNHSLGKIFKHCYYLLYIEGQKRRKVKSWFSKINRQIQGHFHILNFSINFTESWLYFLSFLSFDLLWNCASHKVNLFIILYYIILYYIAFIILCYGFLFLLHHRSIDN